MRLARVLFSRMLAAAVCGTLLGQAPAVPGPRDRRLTVLQAATGALPGRSQAGLGVKPHPADRMGPDCLEVVSVLPGFPADKAGVKPGDLVLAVDGRPVATGEAFATATGHAGTYQLSISRGGREQKLALTLPEKPDANPFAVPGSVRTAPSPSSINTLRSVFIDPGSGSLAFIGTYDPAYPTGPIDYASLLADALHSPYPAFSLDPSPASKATRDALLRKVDTDMARVQGDLAYGKSWMIRIGSMLLSDPALGLDRQRFQKKGAEAMGGTPEQVGAFWDLVSGRVQALSPKGLEMLASLFAKMGAPEVGQALLAMQGDNAVAGLELLGLGPLLADTRQKLQSGVISQGQASNLMQAAFWEQIMLRLKIPESSWRRAIEAGKSGKVADTAWRPAVEDLLTGAITDNIMLPWLNGLVLSQAFLERFYQVPPVEVVPSFRSGLVPDSELARTFFAADWVLKMMAISPEMAEKVPGHLTYQNYEFRMASTRGIYAPGSSGSIRAWLTPQAVPLRQDPSGRVVTFDPARIAINSELLTFDGGGRSANALEKEAAASYAQEVTRRYDEYARVLPELHRLREAAKVIALVRWARARNQALVPPAPPAPPRPLPASFQQGFWTATFEADARRILFVVSAHGGVDFDQKAGDAWVQPQTEPGLSGSALKQLVGSAALGQQAVSTALKGDLEGARELAQKSEQAMIGDLRSGFPAMAEVPQVPDPTAYAAFQSQALGQSREAIAALQQAKTPEARQPIEQKLKTLQDLMAQGQQNPTLAPKLSVELKQGIMGGTYAAPVVVQQGTASPSAPPVALPSGNAVVAPGPAPARPAPAPAPQPPPAVSPAERARILNELAGLRGELCRIQAQLKRFSATIQGDQAQRAEWEHVTNEAYDHALDQVKDAISDELKDLSMELPKGYLEEKLAKASTREEQERIKRSLRLVQHLKESYDLKDFSVWASYDDYGREEIIEGAKMIAELTGLDEWIKDKLVKKWGLGRVLAFKSAAEDLVAASYDVTSEVLAWRRLNQLNRNSEAFLRAVEATTKRMKTVMEGIHARELKLGLAPGATKSDCP